MTELPLHGECQCGGVRFEIGRPLLAAGYCHCSKCRRRTGTAASASAYVEPGSVTVTQGAELMRAWQPGDGFERVFCGTCGSPLWSAREADHEIIVLRLGVLDEDPGIRPSWRQFVDSAAAWEPIPDDGVPRYPGRRPA